MRINEGIQFATDLEILEAHKLDNHAFKQGGEPSIWCPNAWLEVDVPLVWHTTIFLRYDPKQGLVRHDLGVLLIMFPVMKGGLNSFS